jgi:hypothetical protein
MELLFTPFLILFTVGYEAGTKIEIQTKKKFRYKLKLWSFIVDNLL